MYRRNLLGAAKSALNLTYPTVHRLLGHVDFQALVADLLLQIIIWGGGLLSFDRWTHGVR